MNQQKFDFGPSLEADYTREHKPLTQEAYTQALRTIHDSIMLKPPKPPVTDFSDSHNPGRPLKANGAAGLLAQGLKEGKMFTIQSAISFLREKGKVSNSPDRRLREARNWLDRNGYTIEEIKFDGYSGWKIKRLEK